MCNHNYTPPTLTEEEIQEFEEIYDRKMTNDEVRLETINKELDLFLHRLFELKPIVEHYKNNVCKEEYEERFEILARKIERGINALASTF